MTVVLRSYDVHAAESKSHGVLVMVTKGLVPHSCVRRRGAITFVSNNGTELTGMGMKVGDIVVHDEDEASMWITWCWLSDGWVVEANVMPFAKMLVGDDARGSVLGHAGRMGGPDVDLTSVAIHIDKVEFNEPVPLNVNIEAFDVDGVAEHGIISCVEGGTIGLHAYVGTCIHKAKSSGRMRH
jgi:hypothetical protein